MLVLLSLLVSGDATVLVLCGEVALMVAVLCDGDPGVEAVACDA